MQSKYKIFLFANNIIFYFEIDTVAIESINGIEKDGKSNSNPIVSVTAGRHESEFR